MMNRGAMTPSIVRSRRTIRVPARMMHGSWRDMDEAARAADPHHKRTFLIEAAARGRPEPDVKLESS